MAKPNYQFEKRQRDLAKRRKQEEKRLRKLGAKGPVPDWERPAGEIEPQPTAGPGAARDSG